MAARLGRKVWPQRGWDYPRKLGHSAQGAEAAARQGGEPEEQAAYKKSWPRRWASVASGTRVGRSRSGRSTGTGSG